MIKALSFMSNSETFKCRNELKAASDMLHYLDRTQNYTKSQTTQASQFRFSTKNLLQDLKVTLKSDDCSQREREAVKRLEPCKNVRPMSTRMQDPSESL